MKVKGRMGVKTEAGSSHHNEKHLKGKNETNVFFAVNLPFFVLSFLWTISTDVCVCFNISKWKISLSLKTNFSEKLELDYLREYCHC